MKKKKRRRVWPWVLLALAVLIPLGVLGGLRIRDRIELSRIPELTAEERMVTGPLEPYEDPETETGRALCEALRASWSCELLGEPVYGGDWRLRTGVQRLAVTTLDPEALGRGLGDVLQQALSAQALAARRSDEVYDETGAFREELARAAFDEALLARLAEPAAYCGRRELELGYRYEKSVRESWTPDEGRDYAELQALRAAFTREPGPDAWVEALYQTIAAELTPVFKEYEPLAENATRGPKPDAAFFGRTQDPAEVRALLSTVTAQRLMGGQETVWNEEIALYGDGGIRYYLDDTILVLVWQEVEAEAVGTFSEVFIADGSQLRRKISGDQPFDLNFETTTDFCRDANAVLAEGGDFYYHDRNCGVSVYQRQICRFEPHTCDVCYVTAGGDLLFSYRDQFETQAQAEQFIAENDVLFSLAFGPVLIDNGVDVTPNSYMWGEIGDRYARSALGLLGERHYLTMNINCSTPGQPTYNLATLRQAADAMLARGCLKAYTLDGGQTATTAFNGELINPVQFGAQKPISDVIYFATAVPD
ncbi:MAG: phosphodiester glycosidase family protein [Oscillospiraceae bacterium]|nr:phosphodiester glycosidase family protein [Oscillospiraceae bacterium]